MIVKKIEIIEYSSLFSFFSNQPQNLILSSTLCEIWNQRKVIMRIKTKCYSLDGFEKVLYLGSGQLIEIRPRSSAHRKYTTYIFDKHVSLWFGSKHWEMFANDNTTAT